VCLLSIFLSIAGISLILKHLSASFLVFLLLKKATNVIILSLENSVSKDVTFVETQSFFGSSSSSHQGGNAPSGDQGGGLPILDLPLELHPKIHDSSTSPLGERYKPNPQEA